ncbi:hypothetical protein DWW37_07690 [Bifidobacterium adolescentis]|nr:hypothetical protein DWW37_07690 [Bifidobacterium adolescentis]
MRTLYLLGNGFDLACGLKSRYADYFESRFKWYKGYNSPESKAIPAIRRNTRRRHREYSFRLVHCFCPRTR